MFLHKFDILNRNQNGLFQKLLPVCDEIMRRDEIRWFDGIEPIDGMYLCRGAAFWATQLKVAITRWLH